MKEYRKQSITSLKTQKEIFNRIDLLREQKMDMYRILKSIGGQYIEKDLHELRKEESRLFKKVLRLKGINVLIKTQALVTIS